MAEAHERPAGLEAARQESSREDALPCQDHLVSHLAEERADRECRNRDHGRTVQRPPQGARELLVRDGVG